MEKFVDVLIKKRCFLAAWEATKYLNPIVKDKIMNEIVERGDLNSFKKLLPLYENGGGDKGDELVKKMIICLLEMGRISEAKETVKLFSSEEKKKRYKEVLKFIKNERCSFI